MTWAEIEREREFVDEFSDWLRRDIGGKFGKAAERLWRDLDSAIEDFKTLERVSWRIVDVVAAWEEYTCDEVD